MNLQASKGLLHYLPGDVGRPCPCHVCRKKTASYISELTFRITAGAGLGWSTRGCTATETLHKQMPVRANRCTCFVITYKQPTKVIKNAKKQFRSRETAPRPEKTTCKQNIEQHSLLETSSSHRSSGAVNHRTYTGC